MRKEVLVDSKASKKNVKSNSVALSVMMTRGHIVLASQELT
jgi:hypothetical protein